MKKLIGTMLVLALVLGIVVGDGFGASTPAAKATGKTFLNIVTSTTGGTFYAVGGNLAYMISPSTSPMPRQPPRPRPAG